MENQNPLVSAPSVQVETARFMGRVYGWMTFGITLTAAVSFYIMNSPDLLLGIVKNPMLFMGLIVAELAAVISLSALIKRINSLVAGGLYLLYAALTGVTLSVVFYSYTKESIVQVFAMTAIAFAGLSFTGYVTKRDLGPVGSFCSMGLFGLIGWGLLSIFFPSMMGGSLSPTYSIIGLVVFAGLTAYDTQKIKSIYSPENEGTDTERKGAIFGALTLYLDFINLFLMMLRLMGNRK